MHEFKKSITNTNNIKSHPLNLENILNVVYPQVKSLQSQILYNISSVPLHKKQYFSSIINILIDVFKYYEFF